MTLLWGVIPNSDKFGSISFLKNRDHSPRSNGTKSGCPISHAVVCDIRCTLVLGSGIGDSLTHWTGRSVVRYDLVFPPEYRQFL